MRSPAYSFTPGDPQSYGHARPPPRPCSGHDRRIEVLDLDGVAKAKACHAVFVSREEWRLHPQLLKRLARRGLLTIGEGDDFVRKGGVLGVVRVDQTVSFAVNLEAGRRAGLRVSSQMLALAVAVYESSPH